MLPSPIPPLLSHFPFIVTQIFKYRNVAKEVSLQKFCRSSHQTYRVKGFACFPNLSHTRLLIFSKWIYLFIIISMHFIAFRIPLMVSLFKLSLFSKWCPLTTPPALSAFFDILLKFKAIPELLLFGLNCICSTHSILPFNVTYSISSFTFIFTVGSKKSK